MTAETKQGPSLTEPASTKETERFVFMDDVKNILEVATAVGKNVILYGPGGYGKSEYALAFLQERSIEPYVITMGTGMTTDRLFGGLNLPVFNETGKVEYLVENSFMNSEYVIFEELFDAPDFILEQLKDILSSGVFRNGTQVFPIKTEVIICCTNKTREEFAKNNSLKALMERFPLELKVVWKDHNRITYERLFKQRLGFSDPMLTYILEQYAIGGATISPRIAIDAALIVDQCGPNALNFIADFALKPDLLKNSITKFNSILEINKLIVNLVDLENKYKKIRLDNLQGVQEAGRVNKLIYAELNKLKSIKADDSVVSTSAEAVKKYNELYSRNKKALEQILEAADEAPVTT